MPHKERPQSVPEPDSVDSGAKKLSPHEISWGKVQKEINERVQDILPLVKRARTLKELFSAADVIEHWSEENEMRIDRGEEIPDPKSDEESMKEYLKQYISMKDSGGGPLSVGRRALKIEIAEKCKELGIL